MKRALLLFGVALCFFPIFAADQTAEEQLFAYNNTVLEIYHVGAPYEINNFVVFTAPATARFTGIAFDFEGYKTIHPFSIRTLYDMDGKPTESLMFYILSRPAHTHTISYRLVIDGLWTTDPANPDTYFDEETGILLSRFTFNTYTPLAAASQSHVTAQTNGNAVRFVYRGASGQKIYLAGSFTNWDPWIYELTETTRGFYEIHVPLAPGTYYYTFYSGMNTLLDATNSNRAYTKDGRTASVITVK
ncbi:MAG: glycogen-binding domain-containing protein [Treponema sp.]|nr:glycogen-binding domain-containing protein [Treponema sp.]